MSPPAASRRTGEKARTLTKWIGAGWRRQLLLFLAAYCVYDLARWVFVGDPSTAIRHAHWILRLERGMGVAIEASVQRALDSSVPIWVLSNVYLAAQLVVPPARVRVAVSSLATRVPRSPRHGARHVADRHPDLRPVSGGAA